MLLTSNNHNENPPVTTTDDNSLSVNNFPSSLNDYKNNDIELSNSNNESAIIKSKRIKSEWSS